jgi:hypothetical protein
MSKLRKNLNKQMFLMAVLGLLIAVVWIYLSVFDVLNKKEEEPVLTPQETSVINPQLDEEVFDELEKRNY